MDTEKRFWAKVDKRNDCWAWTAAKQRDGYGLFYFRGKMQMAHRVSYELSKGQIPAGLEVLHECDHPPCVRPNHLFLGTQSDNLKDAVEKGRAKHPDPSHLGELHGNAKLTEGLVRDIRWLRQDHGFSIGRLGFIFDVSESHIYNILQRKSWAHVET